MRAAIFLDRDGTINACPPPHHYLTAADDFGFLPGAAAAMSALAQAGYVLVVVSNQRGVARGLVDPLTLHVIEARIQLKIAPAAVAGFYYCQHDLEAGCACRKPEPGLILAAATDLKLDLQRSWMIGDNISDVIAGTCAGCRTILLGDNGHATAGEGTQCVRDLFAAAQLILAS
jgi:D-glycero-D-manno-heptose 1,7-bisphosphate phosphatase